MMTQYEIEQAAKYAQRNSPTNDESQSAGTAPEPVQTPLVGSGRLVGLPEVSDLPDDIKRQLRRMIAREWTCEDWQDLLRLQRIINHNVAARHGLLRQPNGRDEPQPPKN